MRVLIVGGGGREHAIVRALARSPRKPELLCTPGNPGIGEDAQVLGVAGNDVSGLVNVAVEQRVQLVVVGPEAPLVEGLVDALAASGIAAFGPTAAAARLEGSKAFAKQAMEEAEVPTARWRNVNSLEQGLQAAHELVGDSVGAGVVIKADGLAAGKGVTVAEDSQQAERALTEIFLDHRFSDSTQPASAVVEECLVGAELSLLALCDGERAVAMAPARDYKRIFEGDRGPNTGGMGSFSPVPGLDESSVAQITAMVHQPIVDLMRSRGTPFHGVLYAGLMLTADGPRVLEFNVRFGDPETQAVLPRLQSDLLELLLSACNFGGLREASLRWSSDWAVTVVLASAGYPESASSGDLITGLQDLPPGVQLTHAGTASQGDAVLTAGGRVLNVTALGADPASARAKAYAAARMISFEGMQLRRDIGVHALEPVRE